MAKVVPEDERIGSLVAGRYRILRKLGQGGMGIVYEAEQEVLGRRVALKVLGARNDMEAQERFVREARAASRLNHPNVATIYDFGHPDSGPFLAMELVEGKTLRQCIKESTPLPWPRVHALATQIARGLAAAHHQGIVHRDIKPENIVVQGAGAAEQIKILDFGLAQLVSDAASPLTTSGVVMGTAAYISPEQLDGINSDVRSDLYALGLILYEMLSGKHPFAGMTSAQLLFAQVAQVPPPLGSLKSDVPTGFCELVDRLLSKRVGDRPDDGAALVNELDALRLERASSVIGAESAWSRAASDAAPQGRVTLVFTDIEGSSSLWERVPRAMREALDTHNAVIREALRVSEGYEVKTQGDSFMVAFASETRALQWCLQVQRTLAEQLWPPDLERGLDPSRSDGQRRRPSLRVRMGAHIGSPECRRDPVNGRMDYFGPIVNRASRIEAAAHGGQILVGAELARVELAGASFEARGEHRLKGLEQSEQLFELVDQMAPPRSFPPPRAHEERRTNLASDHSLFVGRAQETREISARIRSGTRLITLIGPGGTGKTRLSQVVASEVLAADDGPDEAWFCDLSSATQARDLTTIVADVLSLPLAGGEALQDAIELVARSLVRRGNVLLVMDNLEQIVAAAPTTIGTWLAAAPQLRVLATSREALCVEGEERLELAPLNIDHGVSLFAARVKELGRPAPTDEAAVRALVEALDGMPLAIELAASRTGMLSPAQIVERLHRRFDLLRGTRRDVSARQATLRGAIDWSWDLLSKVEQQAFAQLSVFEGGFAIEAAEEVVELSNDSDAAFVLDVVQALKDKSLLCSQGGSEHELRLTMLRSIREYALEKLAESPNEGLPTKWRHAAYFVREGKRHAKATRTGGAHAAMQWLARNRQNLMSIRERFGATEPALAWAALLALEPLLAEQDPTESYRSTLDDAISLARAANDEVMLAEALLYRADLEQERGSATDALAFVDEAQTYLTEQRAPRLYALAHARRGRILYRLGKLELTVAALDAAEPLARAHGAHSLVARILSDRAMLSLSSLQAPPGLFEEALALARRAGDRVMEARVLGNQGVQHMILGRLAEAEDVMNKCLALHRENNSLGLEGMTLGNLGQVTRALGRLEESERLLAAGIAIHREVGNTLLEGADLANLAATFLDGAKIRDAIAAAKQALALLATTEGARETLLCRCSLAMAYASCDQLEAGRKVFAEAQAAPVPLFRAQPKLFALVAAYLSLAEARLQGGAPDDGRLEQGREALAQLQSEEARPFMLTRMLLLGLASYPSPPEDLSCDTAT